MARHVEGREKNDNDKGYENNYLAQFYSFLNYKYIKYPFEEVIEDEQPIKKKIILSPESAYKRLIQKFRKVIIENNLYNEEVEVNNENEKIIKQMFSKNIISIKKLYKKKNVINTYLFLLILFNVISLLPYQILPIQKFIEICDKYVRRGLNLLAKTKYNFYNRRKKIHKIYIEPVFNLLTSIWNNHHINISLSNTMIILQFFYKIYVVLKILKIRNVKLFDNIHVLCASYVNKICSTLW